MDKLIQVQAISKSFGKNIILKDLSVDVNKGEVIGIIGSSGCGKSTLVRCMAGIESIQSGNISIEGKEVRGVRNIGGKIGIVFQNFNLFPHYTVLNNIVKPLRTIRKVSQEEAKSRARALLGKVHLEDKQEQYPSTLSGGQKQRVAIARALAMNPDILFFDEPTSSLDPELAHEVFETIQELAREGQTMVVVTHQINALKHFATRVLFLHEGKIEEDGTPKDLFEKTKSPALRKFLRMVEFEDFDEGQNK